MSSIAITPSATGAGVITLAAPVTATNRTITLPDATGTVLTTATAGVPIGGPAFSAYQSAGQTNRAATSTKALFQTEEFDTNSNFASSTFTPTVAGYYQVSGGWQPGTSASNLIIYVFKNGAVYKNIGINVAATNWVYGSCLVYCNGSTDYIELYFNSTVLNTTYPTQQSTYFQAAMVRSAT